MNKYAMTITKDGYMKYISHLDMIRLFKNSFKRAGIKLTYSQGFNPHPKMSFAQPLPLGYASSCEVLEFEVKENMDPEDILNKMGLVMPKGIGISRCERTEDGKSLAARMFAASYEVHMPAGAGICGEVEQICKGFLGQEQIVAEKRQKKTQQKKDVDIKMMIRSLEGNIVDNNIVLYTTLNSGSNSNLSPELLISAFVSFAGIDAKREEIDVKRTGLFFGSSDGGTK